MVNAPLLQLSDEELITGFQQEKDMAFIEVLYGRYHQKVFRYCYKIIGNREDAQDACGDIFLKVIEHLDTLREAVTFQAWLFGIARNRSINISIQKQKTHYIELGNISPRAETTFSYGEHLEKDQRIEMMEEAIQALSTKTRDLLKAKYQFGKSINELKEKYGVSESAMKMRLARGRRKVAGRFARQMAEQIL